MDWQPIETAPKDGTRILIYPVRFHDVKAARYFNAPEITYWFGAKPGYPESGYWVGASLRKHAPEDFTHWQPLPEPPTTTHKAGE